jgi:hypothetical protein
MRCLWRSQKSWRSQGLDQAAIFEDGCRAKLKSPFLYRKFQQLHERIHLTLVWELLFFSEE